jgi:hypothetical protein
VEEQRSGARRRRDRGFRRRRSGPALDDRNLLDIDSFSQRRLCDGCSELSKINGVASHIAINSRFPDGQSSLAWLDVSGQPHVFGSTTEFLSFASAIAGFEAQIDLGLALTQPSLIP